MNSKPIVQIKPKKKNKLNRYSDGEVHLWAGTQVVVVTVRYLFLGKADEQVDLFSGGSVCTYHSR